MCAQFLRTHSRLCNFSLHVFQQCGAYRLHLLIRDTAKQRTMIGCLPSIDVPMSVGHGMRLCPGFDCGQQEFYSVFRLDLLEVGAVLAKIEEERLVIGDNALSDDRNSQSAHGYWFGRRRFLNTVSIDYCCLAERIQLVSRPKVRR